MSFELRHIQTAHQVDTPDTEIQNPIGLEPSSTTSSETPPATILDVPALDFPDGGLKAYLVVFGSFLGLIANFGILNAIGAIQAYVSTHQLKNVGASTISWIFSLYMFLTFLTSIFVGPVFDRAGSFYLLVAGGLLILAGFMGLSESTQIYQFILSLSVCIGIGHALSITPLIGVINHWFLNKRGAALGTATLGGSVGGIVIPLLLRALYPKLGYPWAMRVLGFLCMACMIIAIILSRSRLQTESREQVKREKSGPMISWEWLADLKDLKFAFLTCGLLLTELCLLSISTYFPTYAIAYGMSESLSYLLVTIFNLAGVVGRLLPGYLSDTLGRFNVMVIMLIGVCLLVFLIWLPFGKYHGALYAFAVTCGFFTALIFSLTPACLGQITPTNKFGQRYGVMYFFASLSNLFGIPMGAAIIGSGSQHNYTLFAMMVGLLAIVGTSCWAASRYCIVGFKLNVKV